MNKKKLVVMMLVLVMVLSLAITALVGCKDKENDDINGFNQTSAFTLEDALGSALWNAADDNQLNSLKASAQLTLTANESVYAIKLNANLALKGGNDANSFGLSFVDVSANNANILNVYYNEAYSKAYGAEYAPYDKMVFVDLGSGDNAKHFSINALSVSDTLAEQDAEISDEKLGDLGMDDTTIVGGVAGILNYFDLVKGMADKFDKKGNLKSSSLYQSDDGQTILLRLKLDRILDNAKDLLGVIDGYTGDLGLALTSSNLGDVLPNITIDIKFKMSGVEGANFENAKLEGIEASLDVPQKDMRISRTSGGDFIRINIDKNYKFGIGLDFNFGSDAKNYNITPLGFGKYTNTNAINLAVKGELTLNDPIEVTFNLNGDKTIGVPAGTYGIRLAIDADPVKLIGKSFNFTGMDNIMNSITGILDAVNYLNIEIKKVNATANDKGLEIILNRVGGALKVNLKDIRLLGDLLGDLSGTVDLDIVLDTVKGLFTTTPAPTADEAADAKTAAILASIKTLIDHMTINVNCGNIIDVKVTDHVVGDHSKDGKPNTTISVDGKVNKTDGINLSVVLKNMLIDNEACGNLEASLEAKDGVVTITAKAKDLKLSKGTVALPIDLVLKITGISYGDARTAFTA